jgi:hypothetical protein
VRDSWLLLFFLVLLGSSPLPPEHPVLQNNNPAHQCLLVPYSWLDFKLHQGQGLPRQRGVVEGGTAARAHILLG